MSKKLKFPEEIPPDNTFLQYLKFDKNAIESVIIGERINPENREMLNKIINEFLPHLKLKDKN